MGATQSIDKICILQTPRGSLKGVEKIHKTNQTSIYRRFTRVPYAAPPVGSLRWRRPQPLPTAFSFNDDDQPGDYTQFGPVCPQPVYENKQVYLENPDAAPEPPRIESEDCLYLNCWIPSQAPPPEGWPIYFFIHGGWLQVGDANQSNNYDPFDLFYDTDTPRIIVAPTYRLNVFGFLTSQAQAELKEEIAPGNYGLWDQRLALEWTYQNIHLFGGNANNITVGGLSAGAYSAFFQLFYDTRQSERIIRRIALWSNAVGVQPNAYDSHLVAEQFDELTNYFGISLNDSAAHKLECLRKVPERQLVQAISHLKLHTFRACTENSFITDNFLDTIHDGSFASKLGQYGVSIMLGEVANENRLYKLVNPGRSYDTLIVQLENYYPPEVVREVLKLYDLPSDKAGEEAWADCFGRIAADCQVHCPLRGLTQCLLSRMPIDRVHRYRIQWRAKSLDEWLEPRVGVCHGADAPIWWCSGYRAGFSTEDKAITQRFLKPFNQFLKGTTVSWGTEKQTQIRQLDSAGNISVVEDENWDQGLLVWNAMWRAHTGTH
ncbi:MAG: hypothetical protein Q9227_006383 [Pyrenula ochraceoflavens]